ncbi:hypothetical protein ACEWB3_12465, partial [Staphylococcus haemolyticus]
SLEIEASPEQIVTTVGATHALDVICRALLKPGDAVMVENRAGQWSSRVWRTWACACCRCHGATRDRTWR